MPDGRGTFQGAVAIYGSGADAHAVIFSGLCSPPTKSDGMKRSFRVGVGCIKGIASLNYCTTPATFLDLDERDFDPGVRPEFPAKLYAVKGRLSGNHQAGGNLTFERLEVDRFQKIPREMFGAFEYCPQDRQDYVSRYLTSTSLNDDGYRILK